MALGALLAGATTIALVATGFALAAALLNAAVGLCLGCAVPGASPVRAGQRLTDHPLHHLSTAHAPTTPARAQRR
ncbi:DUF4395 family protein [Aeromicrobium sp. UC242_57]|uniref:DUF4395 family protein n=1 Tax=Aeromicrobium sp. UC242_57 TaxID=3374624 RepID=UPI003797C56E